MTIQEPERDMAQARIDDLAIERTIAVSDFISTMQNRLPIDGRIQQAIDVLSRYENEQTEATLASSRNWVQAPDETTIVASSVSGRNILPTTSNQSFTTLWWALWEQKNSYEQSLARLVTSSNSSIDTSYELALHRCIFIETTSVNIEDQMFLYDQLAKVTALMYEYCARAQALSLF